MVATVKRFTYDEDRTGRNPANLIRNERHTITPQNRTPQNVLIPGFAPFYRQSLIVTDMASGLPLREGIDYTVEWPILDTSDNTEGYTPLYMGIQFVDNSITGQFELQYQTIGGQWALDGVQIAQALANAANDPLTTTYADLIGRPIKLPPLEHVHSIEDFVGFGDLCHELELLREGIEILAREDRDSHPGYETLVDHYFELDRFTKELNGNITALDNKTKEKINTAVTDLTSSINTTKDELSKALEDGKNDLDGKVNALRESTNGSINTLRDTLTRSVEQNKNDLTGELNKLSQRLTTSKNDLDGKVNALREVVNNNHTQAQTASTNLSNDLNRRIEQLKRELQQAINTLRDNTNTNINTLRDNLNGTINQNKTDIEGKVTSLRNDTNNSLRSHDTRITAAHNAGADWNTNLRNIPNTLHYNTHNYVRTSPNDGQYGGIEIMKNGKRFVFESTPDNRLQVARMGQGGVSYFKVVFPEKSGTVALDSDLAELRNQLQNSINQGGSGLQALTNRLNNLEQRLNALNDVNNRINAMNSRFNQIEGRFNDYVRKSGDTMYGTLRLPRISIDGIDVWKNSSPPQGGHPNLQIGARLQVNDLYIN